MITIVPPGGTFTPKQLQLEKKSGKSPTMRSENEIDAKVRYRENEHGDDSNNYCKSKLQIS